TRCGLTLLARTYPAAPCLLAALPTSSEPQPPQLLRVPLPVLGDLHVQVEAASTCGYRRAAAYRAGPRSACATGRPRPSGACSDPARLRTPAAATASGPAASPWRPSRAG